MDELRDMMQTLVGAMTAQQQLLQQHLQPQQPQQPRDQYSDGGENQTRGETSEYRGETEDPAIPVENVAIVKQFLKLKPPTFSGEMDPVKANEWLLEMEKNFRLLRCGEQQKVEIGSYLLTGAASRWWNLKGIREPSMNWARFKVIFREKYVPRALQNAKCAEFEHLKQTGKPIAEYEAAFTNLAEYVPHLVATDEMRARRFEDGLRYEIKRVIRPLVLPTYADVLDRAIIVEQDEMEEEKYFDSKKRQNFNNEGPSGQKKQKPESNWRNQRGQIPKCLTLGHIRRNRPKLGTGAIVPRGNQGGGNARPGGNRQDNQGNRSGTGNNQRQGQAFALMPGDARNDEIVVAGKCCNKSPVLFEAEQQRFYKILSSVEEGDLYSIEVVLNSMSFFRSFGLKSKSMASSGGDNAKDKLEGSATPIANDKVENQVARTQAWRPGQNHGCPQLRSNVIDEKCPKMRRPKSRPPRRESRHLWPRRKGPCSQSDKKKGLSAKAIAKSRETSGAMVSKGAVHVVAPLKGTSANHGVVLGLKASMLKNSVMAEKLLEGVIPPSDKEDIKKLDPDRAMSKFFHRRSVVLGSFLASHGREMRDETKENRDATVERFQKVADLKKNEALAKKSSIEEYKSSDDFWEAVEFTTSKYFGEGFDFCKRQIGHLHLNLDIQDMGIDAKLLEKEEDEEESGEEKEREPDNSLALQ
ncbi:hypothetical protein Acr_04g0005560 [Actinidia rufa]|uniref:Retrotransposon gag domain-containing protein n=1 Tax=Actinidia rufa TaxID=165716 RepID=A0A7J0EH71_9ERIC|nr:hypothetical protein Acr_04g0005560 [Actinidia rufa]